MNAMLVFVMLAAAQPDGRAFLCPAYPNDPPWRPWTCYVEAGLGVLGERPSPGTWNPRAREFDWQPVNERWE